MNLAFSFGDIKRAIQARLAGHEPIMRIYRTMLKARLLDQKITELYRRGELSKAIYSEKGQEAGPAVIGSLLRKEDYLIPYYRGYAAVLGKGLELEKIVAEIMGRRSGAAKGKGGFGNFISLEHNIFAYSDILGQTFAMALGMAWSVRYKKENRIVAVLFGDGTATRAPFYNALNLSALWSVPLLFVCLNNQYSITTKFSECSRTSLGEKVRAFGLSYVAVDGNDIFAILRTVKKCIMGMREMSRPAFLELITYRVPGHSLDDPGLYQDENERRHWQARDPLTLFARAFLLAGLLSEKEIAGFVTDCRREIEATIAAARRDAPVVFSELETEVYA